MELNLDLLLTVVGIVLATIGVGVLLLGKSRHAPGEERRNVFEAFGIKLDVANPSVLLIMFGVVLMLTPRVMPLDPKLQALAPLDEPSEPALVPPEQAEPIQPAEPTEEVVELPMPGANADTAAAAEPADATHQLAAAAARARQRELAELRARREAIAREQRALALERARIAEQKPMPVSLPAEPTASGIPPAPPAATLPRLAILTEALNYDGETDGSLRAKLHRELAGVVQEEFGDAVAVESANPGFRKALRLGDMSALCKRTQADHLLLADLTPVEVESFTVESANWPNMRYSAVACDSGRVERSSTMRMEPTVGDKYPLQQSVARSARDFVRDRRHLLR